MIKILVTSEPKWEIYTNHSAYSRGEMDFTAYYNVIDAVSGTMYVMPENIYGDVPCVLEVSEISFDMATRNTVIIEYSLFKEHDIIEQYPELLL